MEAFVAKQVHDYQNGKISRRRLIEILTLATTTAYSGKSAGAAEQSGLDVTGRDGSLHVYDPFDYDVQIASTAEENAFRR